MVLKHYQSDVHSFEFDLLIYANSSESGETVYTEQLDHDIKFIQIIVNKNPHSLNMPFL